MFLKKEINKTQVDVVLCACNPSAREAENEGAQGSLAS